MTFYPLRDEAYLRRGHHAIRTGEFRAPRKGEWYLSGAIPEAYKAFGDLSTPYHILTLVRTETKTVTTVRAV